MRYCSWLAPACLVALSAAPGYAQTGGGGSCCQSLTPRIRAGIMTASDGVDRERHEWLQAVVLWRTSMPSSGGYSADSAALIERAARFARLATEEAGRRYLGGFFANGGQQYAEYSADRRQLWVLGQPLPVPSRDSALIVLVDRADAIGGPPRIVALEYISAELPDSYWTKMWTSGDTTFMVRPSHTDGVLLQALRASTVVGAFVGEPR